LVDSLPRETVEQLRDERRRLLVEAERAEGAERRRYLERAREVFTETADNLLDEGRGERWLERPDAASIVSGALNYFDSERYRLWAYCVMPNHVHAVVQPFEGHTLEAILHSWKSFTANKLNALLKRSGGLWQHEYFDHLIRNPESLDHFIRYTLDNPIKAGLKNWKWVGVNKDKSQRNERPT
jgi:REP element-mobilizing transposase RayT